jgi:hypothetical protein
MSSPIVNKLIVATLALGVLGLASVGFYWDKEPSAFNVQDNTAQTANRLKLPVVTGTATITTLIKMNNTLFEKRGGFLSNDILPPGLLMDNQPEWEYGVITQIRDMTRALTDKIGHSTDKADDDADLALAETRFAVQHSSWIMPDAEADYHEGSDFLQQYLERLSDTENPDAVFITRADKLNYWLGLVEVRLAGLSQRLTASVDQDTASDVTVTGSKPPLAPRAKIRRLQTGWLDIDNVFYEARGSSWALIHLLQAVEMDFADVLKDKNAQLQLAQIIHDLEATQQEVSTPVILNGSGFGLWANHSLVMASYIAQANASVVELRAVLNRD